VELDIQESKEKTSMKEDFAEFEPQRASSI
jgi:hypothetical protein